MKAFWARLAVYLVLLMTVAGTGMLRAEDASGDGGVKGDNAEAASARQVIEQTTQRVMSIITEARGYFDKDPNRFYGEIDKVLEDVVDFDGFARGVMGKYASKQMYMSLRTKDEKKHFIASMRRFSDTFKDGLVHTYAKGLLAFSGNRIEILPVAEKSPSGHSVTVVQNIYGEAEKPYVVQYKMRRDRDGKWKLRNVTIEAINLGKVYRSQFASAAKQYNGDIDKVIDNWSVDPTATAKSETAVSPGSG